MFSRLFAKGALLAALLWLHPTLALAAGHWHQAFNRNGLKIETRDVAGSGVRSFRATTTVKASPGTILAVLTDPKAYPRWVYGCERARTVSHQGFDRRTVYEVNHLPWPFSNRDLVVDVHIHQLASGTVRIDLINRPHRLPETRFVRVMQSVGHYLLTPVDADHTRLVWQQHTDPGGHLPDWLVNQLLVQVPRDTLNGLKRMVREPAFAHRRLIHDPAGQVIGLRREPGEAVGADVDTRASGQSG